MYVYKKIESQTRKSRTFFYGKSKAFLVG